MAGITNSGSVVDVNDSVSIPGVVTAVSGTGKMANITVKLHDGSMITVQAVDVFATQNNGPALSENGKPFGVGAFVTVKGSVTAVAGMGTTATLSVTTSSSKTSVTAVPSKSVHAPKAH